MNCKPGDLAVVSHWEGYGRAGEIARRLIGRIVRVVELRAPVDPNCYSSLVWVFEERQRIEYQGKTYWAEGCADQCLTPIRDPGDDARDETLSWLPVPSKEGETA